MELLIVEDQQAMRAALRDLLASAFPQIRILQADSGAGALAICHRERPQVVLMDIRLPDTNGIELTVHLRTYSPAPAVIVISYLDGAEYAAQARAAGACAFITKDRLASELVPAVARALGIARPSARKPKKP